MHARGALALGVTEAKDLTKLQNMSIQLQRKLKNPNPFFTQRSPSKCAYGLEQRKSCENTRRRLIYE